MYRGVFPQWSSHLVINPATETIEQHPKQPQLAISDFSSSSRNSSINKLSHLNHLNHPPKKMPFTLNRIIPTRRDSSGSIKENKRRSISGKSNKTPSSPTSPLAASPASTPERHSAEGSFPEVPNTYSNERLNPKNFLEGPLSTNPATRLRQMLARPGIVVAPGICDGISARAALEAGFTCLYQSGAATTASRLGMPDLAIATLNDFVQAGSMVASLDPQTPVIADADTGFGGPAMVARTIYQYHMAGIAACHIEDQVQTKRCGHLLGKQVVSREEFVTRIRAAVIARDQIPGSDFVIIGRTDSAQVLGMDEAIYRLKLAAAAGADVCFIEGVKTEELLKHTVAELAPTPVLVNVISGGLTPSFTSQDAERMGAKIIIFSLVSCVAAYHGIREAMMSLKKTGTDFKSARGMDPKAFFAVMGLDKVVELDAKAGGSAFQVI
jgi:2-methylisocitrate lyase-like PEP mutase family enzyme